MVAVVFLYMVSAIFIVGAELNAAISRFIEARARVGA
jgi:membrane protein